MAAEDTFASAQAGLISPAENLESITVHDTNELAYVTRAIYVGTGGDVKVVTVGGVMETLSNVPTGKTLNVRAKQVFDTGTTASNMLGMR